MHVMMSDVVCVMVFRELAVCVIVLRQLAHLYCMCFTCVLVVFCLRMKIW
jgi:hypothetical protein